MFTTRSSNGELDSRPMTTPNKAIDEDSSLWFFMSAHGEPVSEFVAQPEVDIATADPGADRNVSVSGTAVITNDLARKRHLWSTMAGAWFSGGVDDPDLTLIQVRIAHASYWDIKDSKLVQVFKMAKAVVTGKPPSTMGEHVEVRMRRGFDLRSGVVLDRRG